MILFILQHLEKALAGEDCSIRLWDLFAEDDSGDLLLGGHDGAAPRS